jgi:hypothetical protein
MTARYLTDEDYEKLSGWWQDNRFPVPPKEMLPENGAGGFMISIGYRDVCAGFIYTTNSKCAWIEWIVADFNYRDEDRDQAILYLIESLKALAKELGFRYIFTSLKSTSLIDKYEACGFVRGDSNSQEMILTL